MNIVLIVLLSFIGTISFGIIDALFFLFIEEGLTKKLEKVKILDKITVPLFIGGLSASVSIFASTFISKLLHKHFEIIETPFIDSIGILVGTIIVILCYYMYKHFGSEISKKIVDLEKHIVKKNSRFNDKS